MGAVEGRVAIVTGAGSGLGRAYAISLAAQGARVVVNDADSALDGRPEGSHAAEAVVDEIRAAGGEAIANFEDVSDFEGGRRLIEAAISSFGELHVLVNNAGILRDRMLFNLSEPEWDDVVRVHLKGHFVPTHFAAQHWRARAHAGEPAAASVVNTTSTSGLLGNPGQTNYGAAKAGIAAFTVIAAQELARYGVRVNAIAPAARTRMTEQSPGLSEMVRPPEDPSRFDAWDPMNVTPLVVYLATQSCKQNGRVFFVHGGTVQLFHPWSLGAEIERHGRWSVAELSEEIEKIAPSR
jgi:NAD(P)-dependent dehydrogenase (short-subunit alcohol dehydrogenase family)